MAISDRLNKLTTDITNAYTSIENKGGTIPSNKNTENMSTAINSIEVIESATAEGESLSLTNTKAMPYKDYKVKGKSEQATRSGKNLFDISIAKMKPTYNNVNPQITQISDNFQMYNSVGDDWNGIYIDGLDSTKSYTISLYATLISIDSGNVVGTAINGTGTNYNKYSLELNTKTKITYTISSSNEIYIVVAPKNTILYENLMIVEGQYTEQTIPSYEPYGVSPSPDYPSDINSVADDVNLFDISKITSTGAITNNGDGTITITNSYSTSTTKKLSTLAPELKVGDTYILNLETAGTEKFIYLYGVNQVWRVGETRTITQADLDSYVFVYGDSNQTITISSIKIAKGTILTPCSSYGKGSVTIKQRGKNLFDYNYVKDYNNTTLSAYRFIQIKDFENTNRYLMSGINTSEFDNVSGVYIFLANSPQYSGLMMRYTLCSNSNQITNNKYVIQHTDTNELYIGIALSQGSVTEEIYNKIIDKFENVQLEKMISGDTPTSYEPYKANDYVFQTSPLRSLPNRVKDTIELQDMQNHTRIGRQTGTLTETTTITLSDAKTDGAYMCNIKPSGTLTGKTIELEAGDYEIIYELAEEVIEPFTQQQATTYLDIIKTGSYENTTNIYTDEDVKPTMAVQYYKKG